MKIVFWTLFVLLVYCYFGYPFLISLFARLKPRLVKNSYTTPLVSIILSVWNEEDVIEQKLKNLFALDYPLDKIEILLGSDGSSDRTNEIIRKFPDPRLKFFEFVPRGGKMRVLNELVTKSQNEILIFTDARQIFATNAIKELVSYFADPQVGCVSGELKFLPPQRGATAQGINLYWEYEKWIRKMESQVHSMLGATGAIYAIRRDLFPRIPENVVLDDMFIPLKIIEKGFRALFVEAAEAYDEVAKGASEEHRRKARTLYGNYQIFGILPQMLNPFKSPIALQLFSHKLLRVLAPFFMIALFLINWALGEESIYRFFFTLQILFYATALIGALARNQKYGIFKLVSKLCYVPYVFCLLNFSALVGLFRYLTAKQDTTWVKARK